MPYQNNTATVVQGTHDPINKYQFMLTSRRQMYTQPQNIKPRIFQSLYNLTVPPTHKVLARPCSPSPGPSLHSSYVWSIPVHTVSEILVTCYPEDLLPTYFSEYWRSKYVHSNLSSCTTHIEDYAACGITVRATELVSPPTRSGRVR